MMCPKCGSKKILVEQSDTTSGQPLIITCFNCGKLSYSMTVVNER